MATRSASDILPFFLRTIIEPNKRYGFTKFVIVAPKKRGEPPDSLNSMMQTPNISPKRVQ